MKNSIERKAQRGLLKMVLQNWGVGPGDAKPSNPQPLTG